MFRSNINSNYSLRDYKRAEASPPVYRKDESDKPRVPDIPASCLNDAESRSRHPNRETRLANMLLQHIQTETRWTSGVERPFVLGIWTFVLSRKEECFNLLKCFYRLDIIGQLNRKKFIELLKFIHSSDRSWLLQKVWGSIDRQKLQSNSEGWSNSPILILLI